MVEPEVAEPSRVDQGRGPFFDSIFVRGAMAWAREKGFEEALFPGAPTSVTEEVAP